MKTYTLTHPAYGKLVGATVDLDPDDPLVQLNVENGVLSTDHAAKPKAERMTCPICTTVVKNPDDLSSHYSSKHAAFAVPAWTVDSEGKVN